MKRRGFLGWFGFGGAATTANQLVNEDQQPKADQPPIPAKRNPAHEPPKATDDYRMVSVSVVPGRVTVRPMGGFKRFTGLAMHRAIATHFDEDTDLWEYTMPTSRYTDGLFEVHDSWDIDGLGMSAEAAFIVHGRKLYRVTTMCFIPDGAPLWLQIGSRPARVIGKGHIDMLVDLTDCDGLTATLSYDHDGFSNSFSTEIGSGPPLRMHFPLEGRDNAFEKWAKKACAS